MNKLLKIVIGIVSVIVLGVALVFFLTRGMAKTADQFFSAVKNNDIAAARSFLSEDFKVSTSEEELKKFLSNSALLKLKETTWSSREISGGKGELNGEVITETGGVVPLKIMFVKENDNWKIYAIQKPTAGLQSEATSPTMPSAAEKIALTKKTMHDFGVAINEKNMESFRKSVSAMWQNQASVEKFNEIFSPAFGNGDFTALARLEPVVEPVESLGENGELVLKGYFPTEENKVVFQHKYIYEGVSWKLYGFKYHVE